MSLYTVLMRSMLTSIDMRRVLCEVFVYVIVIGCGRLGCSIAQDLSDRGHDVCVIDRDPQKLSRLGSGFNGQRVSGIEYDSENLISSGIQQADALLAVTPDDNVNITVSLVAADIFHVPKIIARANDPDRSYIYDTLKIDSISPTDLSARILANKLFPAESDAIMEINAEYDLLEFPIEKTRNCTVDVFEQKYESRVVLVRRSGSTIVDCQKLKFEPGDTVMCVIPKNEKSKVIRAFSGEVTIWHP